MLVRKLVVIKDIKWKNFRPVCIVHRYDPTSLAKDPLMITWTGTKLPSGFESIGGVVCVLSQPGYNKLNPYPAEISQEGDRLTWTEDVSGGLMMIIVLPAGYILRCLDDAEPQLTESKVIKGRMAVCWLVTPNSDKVKFSLRLERTQCTISELRTHCSALNKEVMERPSGKNLRIPEPKNLPAESSAFPVKSISMRDKLLVFITCGIFILGTLITIGSFILIFLDSSASTSIKMFGQSLTTTNVGIVTLFLGIVMIVITIREVFNVLRSDFS